MKQLWTVVVLMAVVAGCGQVTRQDDHSQKCEIYQLVFDGMVGGDSAIVVQNQTERDWRDSSVQLAFASEIPRESYETLAREFIDLNAHPSQLPDCFTSYKRVTIINRDTLDNIFHREAGVSGSWERFYARYPGRWGVLWFSRPAMTSDSTYCLIYAGHLWGGRAGMGHLFLLKREIDHWKVAAQTMLWES